MDIDSLELTMASGTAPLRQQKLIALGVAIALRADDCIAHHVRNALDAGVTRDELSDAVCVAVAIGGASAASYQARLCRAVERFGASGGTQARRHTASAGVAASAG